MPMTAACAVVSDTMVPCTDLQARDVGDLGDVSPYLAKLVSEVHSAFVESRIIGYDEIAGIASHQTHP